MAGHVLPSDIRLEENGGRGRYFIAMPNGEESCLTFVRSGPGRIVADHTFVPEPYRREAIAAKAWRR
jgi:predicted GNAT family acetyltransferase